MSLAFVIGQEREALEEVAQSTQMLPLPTVCLFLIRNFKFRNLKVSDRNLFAEICDAEQLHRLHQYILKNLVSYLDNPPASYRIGTHEMQKYPPAYKT